MKTLPGSLVGARTYILLCSPHAANSVKELIALARPARENSICKTSAVAAPNRGEMFTAYGGVKCTHSLQKHSQQNAICFWPSSMKFNDPVLSRYKQGGK